MARLKFIGLTLICLALAASFADAARKDMTVYGKPPAGAFGVSTLDQIEGAAKLSMTLIYSYSSSSARKQLDAATPEGQAVLKHRMQVMYPLCGRFTQVRLARELSATDTTIPLKSDKPESIKAFPDTGYVVIEGERIEYSGRTDDSFTGCTRGAGRQPLHRSRYRRHRRRSSRRRHY